MFYGPIALRMPYLKIIPPSRHLTDTCTPSPPDFPFVDLIAKTKIKRIIHPSLFFLIIGAVMATHAFALPPNGLVAFNGNGHLCYGVFLGISEDDMVMLYSPDRDVPHVYIKICDQEEYQCNFLPYDYLELQKKPRDWWKGFIIEIDGKRFVVTQARRSFPRYKTFLVHYRDHARFEHGISFEDPRLKFVGHV